MAVLVHGVSLVQRPQAVWGMAPGVCSGLIAEHSHPSLQKGSTAGVVVQGQVKLVLPDLSFPGGFCLTSLPSVTAVQSPGVLPLCSSIVCGGRRELCHRVRIRGGGGSPSAVGRTNVIDLLWHLTKPQTLTPPKKPL